MCNALDKSTYAEQRVAVSPCETLVGIPIKNRSTLIEHHGTRGILNFPRLGESE